MSGLSATPLQSDMAEVRERFARYQLTLETPAPRDEAIW